MALTTLTVAQLTSNLNALYMALGNPTCARALSRWTRGAVSNR